MNQQEFQKKLQEILALARSRDSYMKKEEIQDFFREEPLEPEQLDLICGYLLSQKIAVEGFEETGHSPEERSALSPEDEKFLRRYREEAARIPAEKEGERQELLRLAAQKEDAVFERLSELYLLPVADLAEEMYCREVSAADLVQEGNLHVMLALRDLPAEEKDLQNRILSRVREGMRAFIEQQKDQQCADRKMVSRVDELKENISALKEKLGRKVYLDELADYMKISQEEVEAVLKLAGEDVPKEE